MGPAQARIFRIKEAVPLAALPATCTQEVLAAISDAYPQFIDGVNVLHTGMNNMGAIFHPALTLLNMGWIEATHGDYQFYIDGVTPSVAAMLEFSTVNADGCLRAGLRPGRTGMAETGVRYQRAEPSRSGPQPAGLLWHQGAPRCITVTSLKMCR